LIAIKALVRWKLPPAWSVLLKSSNDGLDSTPPVNTDREQLLRELANEFGYELMSKVANYSFINRLGTFDQDGKLVPGSDV
jgi:hypothetical protein